MKLALEKYRDIETRARGPWRSLEMTPFDRSYYDFRIMFSSNHPSSV